MDVVDLKVDQAYEESDRLWYRDNERRLAALIGRFIHVDSDQRCIGCQSAVFRISDAIGRSYRMFCAVCGVGNHSHEGKTILSGFAGRFVTVAEALAEGQEAEERMLRGMWMQRQPTWGEFSAHAAYGAHFCRPEKGRELVDRGLDTLRTIAAIDPAATHYQRVDAAALELA